MLALFVLIPACRNHSASTSKIFDFCLRRKITLFHRFFFSPFKKFNANILTPLLRFCQPSKTCETKNMRFSAKIRFLKAKNLSVKPKRFVRRVCLFRRKSPRFAKFRTVCFEKAWLFFYRRRIRLSRSRRCSREPKRAILP